MISRTVGCSAAGVTCIELVLVLVYLASFVLGAQYTWRMWIEYGLAWQMAGAAVGGLIGIAAAIGAILALLAPFWIYLLFTRAMSPAVMVCNCEDNQTPVSESLLPGPGAGLLSIAASQRLDQIPELSLAISPSLLQNGNHDSRLPLTRGWRERIAIAAHLGLRLEGLEPEPFSGPRIEYNSWAPLPRDISGALRCGLPPRLILAWVILLLQRTLPIFEKEFHQDTRPRQILGASALILVSASDQAQALLRELSKGPWSPDHYGCRQASRGFLDRVMDKPTPGSHAALAAHSLAQLAYQYALPDRLWMVYEAGDMRAGYETPDNRIAWSQPGYYAELASNCCARAAVEMAAEYQWQRRTLAALVVGWRSWAEDREDWRRRLEKEWEPRMEKMEVGAAFDKQAYMQMARARLAPWPNS